MTSDPGRREWLLPSLALGYLLAPFQGSRRSSGLLPLHFFFEENRCRLWISITCPIAID